MRMVKQIAVNSAVDQLVVNGSHSILARAGVSSIPVVQSFTEHLNVQTVLVAELIVMSNVGF